MSDVANKKKPSLSLSTWGALLVGGLSLLAVLFLLWLGSRSQQTVMVPVSDLPVYHRIQESDLRPQTFRSSDLSEKFLAADSEIADRYSLVELPAGKPLRSADLGPAVPPGRLSGVVPVSLPVDPAMLLLDHPRPGDSLTVLLTFPEGASQRYENLLVLAVKSPDSLVAWRREDFNPLFWVVLAVPREQQQQFVEHYARGSLLLAP